MSLRIVFGAASRHISTSARRFQLAESAPAASSGFRDLANVLPSATAGTSAFTTPTPDPVAEAAAAANALPARGYSPNNVPPKYDPTLDLLVNCLMKHGKKTEAQALVKKILDLLHQTTNLQPQPLLRKSILLASPSVKILSMRKSAKTILTPRALNERQRTRQGIAWILKASEKGRKGGVPRDQRIAREIINVLEGQSDVFSWVEEVHKSGYLNRSNMNAR